MRKRILRSTDGRQLEEEGHSVETGRRRGMLSDVATRNAVASTSHAGFAQVICGGFAVNSSCAGCCEEPDGQRSWSQDQ